MSRRCFNKRLKISRQACLRYARRTSGRRLHSLSKYGANNYLHELVHLLSRLFCCTEQGFVLLLGLDEGFLEQIGVFVEVSFGDALVGARNLLSLLANRMARVCASGSPSLTSAAAFQTQLRSLPTFGESFMSGTTSPWVNIRHTSGVEDRDPTVVVSANLQGLVAPHNQSCLSVIFVLE